jgi:hypothetical protein
VAKSDGVIGRITNTGLLKLAESFAGQEDVGVLGSLFLRLARYLGGDPSLFVQVTSASSATPASLPDNTPALSFVGTVQFNAIAYRVDGSPPNAATDQVLGIGAVITLTGRETMRAFQFCSITSTPATITGQYFD